MSSLWNKKLSFKFSQNSRTSPSLHSENAQPHTRSEKKKTQKNRIQILHICSIVPVTKKRFAKQQLKLVNSSSFFYIFSAHFQCLLIEKRSIEFLVQWSEEQIEIARWKSKFVWAFCVNRINWKVSSNKLKYVIGYSLAWHETSPASNKDHRRWTHPACKGQQRGRCDPVYVPSWITRRGWESHIPLQSAGVLHAWRLSFSHPRYIKI